MATTFDHATQGSDAVSPLMRRDLSIGGPWFDALLLWGQPAIAFIITCLWFAFASRLPTAEADMMAGGFVTFVALLTYAHLIAVAPRAYLNRDVFRRFPVRLTVVPILLVAGFMLSPTLLVIGIVLTVFWDVHHSAMQTFGLGRIYDMKAGNHPLALRHVDMALNAALYVGPVIAGASMLVHVHAFDHFALTDWSILTQTPVLAAGLAGMIRALGIGVWMLLVAVAAWRYRAAMRRGYIFPIHKRVLLAVTATVSIAAWGLAPPIIAFAAINLFHAIQYFALVWLKEGGRIAAVAGPRPAYRRMAWPLFIAACFGFGALYFLAMQTGEADARWFLAPFIACSLLHFWYDGFVWSVRAKQV